MSQETREESTQDDPRPEAAETPSNDEASAPVDASMENDAATSEAAPVEGASSELELTSDGSDDEAADGGDIDDAPAAPEASTPVAAPAPVAPASNAPAGADGQPLEFNWYVLRVQSGREDTCANALRKKIVLAKMDHLIEEIAVPKQKITEIKDGKRRIRAQKMFPGYIFIHMCLDDDLWYMIRDTSGIGDFVGSHQLPTPMPPAEVKKIKSLMEEKEDEAPEVKIDLSKNDMVKIKEGPFENFDGVVEEVQPAKGLVRVMVTIFGRATPVDLEYWQVEKL
ncbi:MAG: transcription termination/antitermination protein NusG [Planctomycetota bacterium]